MKNAYRVEEAFGLGRPYTSLDRAKAALEEAERDRILFGLRDLPCHIVIFQSVRSERIVGYIDVKIEKDGTATFCKHNGGFSQKHEI